MCLGLAFTRFRCLTDFQEKNKCNSCFVTISKVKYGLPDDQYNLIASANKFSSLIKTTKWHVHVVAYIWLNT